MSIGKSEKADKNPATGFIKVKVSISIDPALLESIDFLAVDKRRSRSSMIELLLAHGLVAEATGK